MTVAVQTGLTNLKNYLTRQGFNVVNFGNYPYKIDAVVYKGLTATLMMSCSPSHGGSILFVDCSGKTPFQVAEILRNKLYSPLF